MKTKIHTIGEVSLSALENEWQRLATAAAIAGARMHPDGWRHSAGHADRKAERR
jgi:hypothetical protein